MAVVLNSDRLEVSVDGLTLSPNAEVPHCEAQPGQGEPAAGRSRAGSSSPGQAEAGGEAAEEATLSPERRWGFALEELYGLALRFFKGEAAERRGPHTPRRHRGGETADARVPGSHGRWHCLPARRAGRRGAGGAPGPLTAAGGRRRHRPRPLEVGVPGAVASRGEHRVTAIRVGFGGRASPGEPRQATGGRAGRLARAAVCPLGGAEKVFPRVCTTRPKNGEKKPHPSVWHVRKTSQT